MATIQDIVDNKVVGEAVLNAFWYVRKIPKESPSLLLSDRPLIRVNGYCDPGAVWVLPLTPRTVFVAANHPEIFYRLVSAKPQAFAKSLNIDSARQAERFVFSVDPSHRRWLGKFLHR